MSASYFSAGDEVLVVDQPRLDTLELAARDLLVLRARERDAVRALHVPLPGEVLEGGAPAAPDVEHQRVGRDPGEVGQDAVLVVLRLLERRVLLVEHGARVGHALAEPEAEELVREVVTVGEVLARGRHGAISCAPTAGAALLDGRGRSWRVSCRRLSTGPQTSVRNTPRSMPAVRITSTRES